MNKQTLTIGRIVLFVPPSEDHPTANNGAEVVPAIVTKVQNENCANLTVFPDNREPVCMTDVQYSSAGSAGSWHWPDLIKPADEPVVVKEAVMDTEGGKAPEANEQ